MVTTKTFTSTYHPQTNGQAERFNRSSMAMMRCYVHYHPSNWDEYTAGIFNG